MSASLYVTGTTTSSNFPFTPGSSFPFPPQGWQNGFLIKLDPDALPAQQLRFGTFQRDASPIDVAVLPGGMTAVVGQATDMCLRNVELFSAWSARCTRRASQFEQRPFLSVFSADGAALPFSSFLDATAGTNSFVTSVAANGSPIVYAAMDDRRWRAGTPGALQPSIGGGADALVQAIDLSAFAPRERSAGDCFHAGSGERCRDRSGRRHRGAVDLRPAVRVHGRRTGRGIAHPRDLVTARTASALPSPAGCRHRPARAWCRARTRSLPPGTHTFTLVARDESGAIGTGTLTVNVASVNTNPGALQTVVLTDSKFVVNENGQFGSEHPVSVTFDTVTAPGLTWLESHWDLLPPPPNTLQAGSPPYYYEIKSNAAFTGTVRVCVNIRGMSLARGQAELQLHQLVSGVWTPLTNQDAPTSDEICGDAPGLGTFAIFYPPVPETAIAAIAGTGFAEDSIDPPGGDPRDEFRDQAPALQSTLTSPESSRAPEIRPRPSSSWPTTAINSAPASGCWIWQTGEISAFLEPNECYGFGPLAVDPTGQFFYCTKPDPQTGQVDIYRFDDETRAATLRGLAPEVLAMVTDAAGNLFYSDGNIHRVPAAGGDSTRIFAFNGSHGRAEPAILRSRVDARLRRRGPSAGRRLHAGSHLARRRRTDRTVR